MALHPAMHHFESMTSMYVMWHRLDTKAGAFNNPAFTRNCLAACYHTVRRIGREPNADNRPSPGREAV